MKITENSTKSISETESGDSNLKNIWSHILQEVQNSTKKTPPAKSLILLGDNESGRSTLISRLKGVESISKGIGLEYHYIDIKDEDRDDTPKLGVWIPDGDGTCTGLLKFALNETNIENTIIAFVVSMSTPWTIMDSLKKWSNIIKDHLKKLNINANKLNELKKQQCRLFQMYQDPDENQNLLIKQKPNNTVVKSNQNENDNKQDDDSLLPLDPSVLTLNLGIPVVVIVTKSDCISILDKENEYRIEHFDFIQYHIRKFCLDYGAALFYTTVKDKRTYDKLYKYLIHRLYNYPFNHPAAVVDRESIFIPSGWDNESKINILLENSTTIKSDSEYSDIISKPTISKPLQKDVETVIATDDQEFLSKLQIVLNKATSTTAKPSDETPSNGSMPPSGFKTPIKPQPPVMNTKGPNNGPDSTNLKNFFQNLLNKNAPSNTMTPITPASAPQPTSQTTSADQAAPGSNQGSVNMSTPTSTNESNA